jgi:hypothetical protein
MDNKLASDKRTVPTGYLWHPLPKYDAGLMVSVGVSGSLNKMKYRNRTTYTAYVLKLSIMFF